MSITASYRIDEEGRFFHEETEEEGARCQTMTRRLQRFDEVMNLPRQEILNAIKRAKTSGISGFRDRCVVVVRSSDQPGCYDVQLLDDELELPPASLLRDLYELTTAEANVALAVAEGANAKDLSERFGISTNTARVHLQRILGKTGCSRQTHLVRLILSLASSSGQDGGCEVEQPRYSSSRGSK